MIGIADIAFDEEHVVQSVEVVLVACIGQQVEDDDLVLGCDLAAIMDEARADIAGRCGQMADRGRIDGKRDVLFALGLVDCGIGSGVEDHLRLHFPRYGKDGGRVRDV